MAQAPEGLLASASIGQGPARTLLGDIRPGTMGLYGIARDAHCRVIAAGCQEHAVALKTVGDGVGDAAGDHERP
ncbi:MAG: hypothetical protein V9G19_27805 [Tetrasphaera sp.]